MIDSAYKKIYKNIFLPYLKGNNSNFYDESGMPSYVHKNPFMSWTFWKRIDMVIRLTGNLKNKSVLDFGCGNGVVFKYLNDNNCKITGCEKNYFTLSKEISSKLNIKSDIYQDLDEVKKEGFDVILILDVLEHIKNLDFYLDKLISLANENTKIILSGPTENIFYKIGRFLSGFKGGYHVLNIYQIENKLKKSGLNKVAVMNLFPVFSLFRISSWKKEKL